MVVDSEWVFLESSDVENSTGESGYIEIANGNFVSDKDAYVYALERCLSGTESDKEEFQSMLVEWFYSGGAWRREENVKVI